MSSPFRAYLGDGLFADFDGYQVCLTAEDGVRAHDTVYLDPRTYAALLQWHREKIQPLYQQSNEG